MITTLGSTVVLTQREDRRAVTALTRCSDDPDHGQPSLTSVAFDGRYGYATDTRVLGILPFEVDLPGERVVVPARRLRDALAVARGTEPVRLRFASDALHVVIGDDPLPLGDEYVPTQVVIPYVDAGTFPTPDALDRMLNGDPDLEPDDRVVTGFGINAAYLARLGALVSRHDGAVDDLVTVHPRGRGRPVEVRDANTGLRLGVIAPLRTFSDLTPPDTTPEEPTP